MKNHVVFNPKIKNKKFIILIKSNLIFIELANILIFKLMPVMLSLQKEQKKMY